MSQFLEVDDEKKLQEWRVQWDEILKESVIVKIHIWQWHPYARLTTERLGRLGIRIVDAEAKESFDSILRTGSIDLIPKEIQCQIQRSAVGARNNLKLHTHPVLWGDMLPATAYPDWKEKHNNYEKDFWNAIEYLCANLTEGDNLVSQMTEKYKIIFNDAWARLNASQLEGLPDREEFVDIAVRDIIESIPDTSVIRDRFVFETNFYDAPMSDEIAEAEARAATIRQKTLNQTNTFENERAVIISAMRKEVAAQAENRRREIETSLAKAEEEFYNNLSVIVNDAVSVIQGKGKIGGRKALQLRGVVDKVKQLNVFNDAELDNQMSSLLNLLDTRAETTQSTEKDKLLSEISDSLQNASQYIKTQLDTLPTKRGVRLIKDEEIETDSSSVSTSRKTPKLTLFEDSMDEEKPISKMRRHKKVAGFMP